MVLGSNNSENFELALTLLHSTSIRKVVMVPQDWGIMGWKVVFWLEVISSIPINKMTLLNLIGTDKDLHEQVPHQNHISTQHLPLLLLYYRNDFFFPGCLSCS